MSVSLDLNDKVALVTGASRGIGKAIAEALGSCGATVLGTATTEQGADKISEYFADAGISGRGYVLDVNNADAIVATIAEITANFGAPTILVNNAGITRDNLMLRMKPEEWNDVLNTNLTSVFNTSKAVLRAMMKAKWGRIINISSVVALSGNPGQANYSAAKAGMIGFSKSLGIEVASRGITVNTITPGFIQSDMTNALTDDQRATILGKVPMARLGQAQEIANAVLFLASNMASYITGETINVNGGMYMS